VDVFQHRVYPSNWCSKLARTIATVVTCNADLQYVYLLFRLGNGGAIAVRLITVTVLSCIRGGIGLRRRDRSPGGLHAAASKHPKSIAAILFPARYQCKRRHSTGDLSDLSDFFQQDVLSNGVDRPLPMTPSYFLVEAATTTVATGHVQCYWRV